MCLGRMRHACFDMLEHARRRGARLIAAGSDASDAPDKYLAAGADAVLHGEALATLMASIDRLNADVTLDAARLAAGLPDVSVDRRAALARHRADCPNPHSRRYPPGISSTSRNTGACGNARTAISASTWRRRAAARSAATGARNPSGATSTCSGPRARVAAEMIYLRRHYRPDHVWFADDIFGFKVDWVNEFAAALAEGGGGVPFTIQLRADLVSPRMADALRDAGCREVWIGAESGSQKILDAMNKGTRVAENIAGAPPVGRRGDPRRLFPAARLSRRGARRHPRHAPAHRRGAARRRRRQRVLSTAGHEVLRGGHGSSWAHKTPLAGEQRPRNDVRTARTRRSSIARCATCCTTR